MSDLESISQGENGQLVDETLGNIDIFHKVYEFEPAITAIFEKYRHDIQVVPSSLLVLERHKKKFRTMMEEFRLNNARFLTPSVVSSYQPILLEYEQTTVDDINYRSHRFGWMEITIDIGQHWAIQCMMNVIYFIFERAGLFDCLDFSGNILYSPEPIPTVLDTLHVFQAYWILEAIYREVPGNISDEESEGHLQKVMEFLRRGDVNNARESFFNVVNATRELFSLPMYNSEDDESYIIRHQGHGFLSLYEATMLEKVVEGVWESLEESNDDEPEAR